MTAYQGRPELAGESSRESGCACPWPRPATSGTRDILVERLWYGAYANAGEKDARLVRKLFADREAPGIFGYYCLDRNHDRLQAASIDGIAPEFELIESGVYPLSRPLFVYVRQQHARIVAGLDRLIEALTAPEASGPEGYLIDQGLIPLPPDERGAAR